MTESTALTVQMSLQDTLTLGKVLAESKRFEDATSPEQAVVKVMAGYELGFGPIASMCGIYVIKGRVTISANMMAQAVKRSTRYDYRVIEMTDQVCEIAFFESGNEIGRSRFTAQDAAKAGTQNMAKFPRNMLFARAMSNGVKWFVPDVFQTGVYTPEELGVQVNGEGEILDIQAVTITEPPEPTPPPVFDTTPPDWSDWDAKQWHKLWDAAVAQLQYNHRAHVKNTLAQVFNGSADTVTYEAAWTTLVEHQQAKAATETADEVPA